MNEVKFILRMAKVVRTPLQALTLLFVAAALILIILLIPADALEA